MKYPLIFLLLTATLAGCALFSKRPENEHLIEHTIDEVIEKSDNEKPPQVQG